MRRSASTFVVLLAVLSSAQAARADTTPHRRASIIAAHTSMGRNAPRRLACSAPLPICPAGKIGGAIIHGAGDVIQAGAGVASNAVMGGVVSWAADGAAWLVGEVGKQIEHSSRPALNSRWFAQRYAGMVQLAAALAAVFLLLAVGHA